MSQEEATIPTTDVREQEDHNNNEIFCWGGGQELELSPIHSLSLRGIGIKQVCLAPNDNGYILTKSGQLHQWVSNTTKNHLAFRCIANDPLITEPILQIAAGANNHFGAVSTRGVLYTWGDGQHGKLGHGNTESISGPKVVRKMAGIPIKQVACGAHFSIALTKEHEVYSWGTCRSCGCTGHGAGSGDTLIPQKITTLNSEPITQISCGFVHSAAVSLSGKLYTWGYGGFGNLGHSNQGHCFVPTRVSALSGTQVVQVACGRCHTAVVIWDGSLHTFGWNEHGQLGKGDTQNTPVPTRVPSLQNVAQVSCGDYHSTAVTFDGEVCTWGHGANSQLGHGSKENLLTPKLVEDLHGYKATSTIAFQTRVSHRA